MLSSIVIICLSIGIGVGYLYIIRSFDIYEPEPVGAMLTASIIGGGVSVLLALIGYKLIEVENLKTFISAFLIVGPIEESAKFIALILVYFLISKEFNELIDGIVYMACISLGFAVIENIFYALKDEAPFSILLVRTILPTIGHMAFSAFLGFAFYIHVKFKKNYLGILVALLLAFFAHGLYDGLLFSGKWMNMLLILFLGLLFVQLVVVRTCLSISVFRPSFDEMNFIENQQTFKGTCINCQSAIDTSQFQFKKMCYAPCSNCGRVVIDEKNWIRLLKYFRPLFNWKKYKQRNINSVDPIHFFNEKKTHQFHIEDGQINIDVDIIGGWLEKGNQADTDKLLNTTFVGKLLKLLGIHHIDRFS